MHSPPLLITLLLAAVSFSAHAAPEFLTLDANEMRAMELESIPPFPAEAILEGKSENWESVLHQGDLIVSIYAAAPAIFNVSEPFPYDEFVLVLEGEVTLTNVDGGYTNLPTGRNIPGTKRLDGHLGYAGQVSRDDCDRDRRLTSRGVLT